MSVELFPKRLKSRKKKSAHDVPVEEKMSRAEWLAPIEEAITSRTPDPLAERPE